MYINTFLIYDVFRSRRVCQDAITQVVELLNFPSSPGITEQHRDSVGASEGRTGSGDSVSLRINGYTWAKRS
jgi:hypothetical protein